MSEISASENTAGMVEDIIFEIPPECNVIFYHDNFTAKDFITDILVSVFNKTPKDAHIFTESINKKGAAVAGIYTYDIAVSIVKTVIAIARKKGFPLHIEAERV